MIRRFSSRTQPLGKSFLVERLRGARSYDRIAGYFTGSVLEVAGEEIQNVSGVVRVVCNSQVRGADAATARAAAQAQRLEWCASRPEQLGDIARERFAGLYELLRSGKLVVRVLPNARFGLVHGKAGVVRYGDRATCFMGSVNETREAWAAHHELLWEDDSTEAVEWVQAEFDALFGDAAAVSLAEFVIDDIGRLARRKVIGTVAQWKEEPSAAPVAVEAPVTRREVGLWQHQKYFISLALKAHRRRGHARFVLADQVGLGKTVQLAMATQLMILVGDRPALVLAPRTLLRQWQSELRDLCGIPSAYWSGRSWIDEHDVEHPGGADTITRCPRRIGLVSHGIVMRYTPQRDALLRREWECVVVDEAHRARRRNLGPRAATESADPNRLLEFIRELAPRTRSMLLATATPVQLHPVEAHDLLDALARGNDTVLGDRASQWRAAERALAVVMGDEPLPQDPELVWPWIRNPLPPAGEDRDVDAIRGSLGLADDAPIAAADYTRLRRPDVARVAHLAPVFGETLNPFIRTIVRRTREYLETTLDPETHEPLLPPVRVELTGEGDDDAIALTPYLEDAYRAAEAFCEALAGRVRGVGFLQTLLLRRVGSTIVAGRLTAERMLGTWRDVPEDEEDDDEPDGGCDPDEALSEMARTLTPTERGDLERFVLALKAAGDADPKLELVRSLLFDQRWADDGCIVFSQYLDSVMWIGERLSRERPTHPIGVYAGAGRSGVFLAGTFARQERDTIRDRVREGTLTLLLGTDAASEGLNLQRLGTLINLDLPWNPTRLEQRKGRIQRIGQARSVVRVHNMRYRGSVEDRVHQLLSHRLSEIFRLFGQIPDVLEDAWIDVARGDEESARRRIDAVPKQHPFEVRYREPKGDFAWEKCADVLADDARRELLRRPW